MNNSTGNVACSVVQKLYRAYYLDNYETEQEFTTRWVRIQDAIEQNEKAMKRPRYNGWIKRENFVLNELEQVL